MAIRDARAVFGLPLNAPPEDIEAHWAQWAERFGFPLRLSEEELAELPEGTRVVEETSANLPIQAQLVGVALAAKDHLELRTRPSLDNLVEHLRTLEGVDIAEDRRLWRHERPGKGVPTDVRKMRKALFAYVNDDRWVADCPRCTSGIACARDMDYACCLGCGRVYPITFPKNADEIEDELSQLPAFERNWRPEQVAA